MPKGPPRRSISPDRMLYDSQWGGDAVGLPGGDALVGTNEPVFPIDGEGPARVVEIKPFRIQSTAVSVEQFAQFVDATGYKTEAERFGWSLVFWSFTPQDQSFQRVVGAPWWCKVDGADWAHPFGPGSDICGLEDHPVTHVSWNDATAFADWIGGRLPSEAEWEYAAKGGQDGKFPWGEAEPEDSHDAPCNIWQGVFPDTITAADGYAGTMPVRSFEPNGYGLYNMSGNVWEWCAEAFHIRSASPTRGPWGQISARPGQKLLKGGSYLCHKSYCYRYRIAARMSATADSSTGHTGFRVVLPYS